MVVVYLMVEFYGVVLILVFAHGPSPLLALTGQGIIVITAGDTQVNKIL